MTETWETTVTAFTVTRRGSSWLMIRHKRLGVTRWELPGGHADAGETGVAVDAGRLIATCIHEWDEQQQRKILLL